LAVLAEPLDRTIASATTGCGRGIGDTIADIVIKLHRTGTHPRLEKLRRKVPEGVLEMLSIPGLRPDRINSSTRSSALPTLPGSKLPHARIG
jgi:DNA polymerase (family 10)